MMLASTPVTFCTPGALFDGLFHLIKRFSLAGIRKARDHFPERSSRKCRHRFEEDAIIGLNGLQLCPGSQRRFVRNSFGMITWPLLESLVVCMKRLTGKKYVRQMITPGYVAVKEI